MKKRVLTVALAFMMLTASFAGSLKFEEVNKLTNLVTASAAEQTEGAIKTKFDKTLLYKDDAAFDAEIKRVSDELLPKYKESTQNIDTIDDVVNVLSLYDECGFTIGRLESYSDLCVCLDGSDTAAIEHNNSTVNLYTEYNQISLSALNKLIEKDEAFKNSLISDARLKPWNKMLSYILSQNISTTTERENYIIALDEKYKDSYFNIYSTLIDTDLIYKTVKAADGSEVEADLTNINAMPYDDEHKEYRQKMLESYYQTLKNYENTFADLLNNYITSSESLAKIYGYSSVLEMSANEDGITPDTIMNLIDSARQNTNILVRLDDLNKLAKDNNWQGSKNVAEQDKDIFKYENARETITKALAPLGDEYISLINRAFDEGWIDVYPDDNKMSGGATICYSDGVPCVIVNYTDDYYSLDTLAHELGHAVNDYLSSTNQSSYYISKSKLFTAEIASTTNEVLLARYMENNAKTDEERVYYLMREFDIYNESFFNTVDQTEFEYEIRNIVNNGGVLTAEILDETYANIIKRNNSGKLPIKNMDTGWIYVSQYYSPYYNKSYAFATSAACTVANNILSGNKEATDNYLAFLKAGSSKNPNELYALVGTNLTDPSLTQPLFDRCNEILDEVKIIVSGNAS